MHTCDPRMWEAEAGNGGTGEFMVNLGYIATVVSSPRREGGKLANPCRDSFRTGCSHSALIRSASAGVQPLLRMSVVRAAEHTEICLCNLSDSGSGTVFGPEFLQGKQCWGGGSVVVWIVFLQHLCQSPVLQCDGLWNLCG